ncbi:MAG: hypothetical protein V9E98_13925 [Candidatus Nanopelagicales bacterium]
MTQVAESPTLAGQAQPRRWLELHAVFAVIAVVGVLAPVGTLGVRVLLLVIGYSVAVVVLATRTHDPVLLTYWMVLAPLSVLMVLPDWFLSSVLGILQFPDTGAPFLDTMPLFMAFMWTVALLPIMLIGYVMERSHGLVAALVAVVVGGLVMFTFAELIAPAIPLWRPVDVMQVAGVAPYVLLPEVGLTIATYLLVRGAGERSRWATAAGVVAVPFLYLGMLTSSYQFVG